MTIMRNWTWTGNNICSRHVVPGRPSSPEYSLIMASFPRFTSIKKQKKKRFHVHGVQPFQGKKLFPLNLFREALEISQIPPHCLTTHDLLARVLTPPSSPSPKPAAAAKLGLGVAVPGDEDEREARRLLFLLCEEGVHDREAVKKTITMSSATRSRSGVAAARPGAIIQEIETFIDETLIDPSGSHRFVTSWNVSKVFFNSIAPRVWVPSMSSSTYTLDFCKFIWCCFHGCRL